MHLGGDGQQASGYKDRKLSGEAQGKTVAVGITSM